MEKQMYWRVLTTALFLAVLPQLAQAARITVDAGGTCTLADAIDAANSNADTGGCVGSGVYGDDTITLRADVLLTDALPQISSVITIEGGGHKIDGQENEALGSVLHVVSSGVLTLNEATVTGGNAWRGGGIYNVGILILTNSTVSGNTAIAVGGGICSDGTATLNKSTISGNVSDFGGGICSGGYLTLNNSMVSGNQANKHAKEGGGICNAGGTATLNNSTVSGNMAGNFGGGIFNYGTITLNNSTVSGNSTWNGGGISSWLGTTVLHSSVISGNTADLGSEVSNLESKIIVADSFNLFSHNGENSTQAFYEFTPGSSDVNAASDGDTPTTLTSILSPLANNGGPTQTHALPEGSPAIDLDTTCSTDLTTDQRGGARPIGEGCDAGAYEFSYLDAINQHCPCTKGSNGQWKNHGQYVSCVSNSAKSFLAAGLITQAEKEAVVSAAAKSTCGKKK